MCTLDGKTPFEVLYGQPPNLQSLQIWGCQIWVHSPGGSKLDLRAREVRWLGVDVDTCTHCIFWPGSSKVSVEHDVYFGTTAQLEGEEEGLDIPSEGNELPAIPHTPKTPPSPPPKTPPNSAPDTAKESAPIALRRSSRNQKPSCPVRDLLSGTGTTDPTTARTLKLPGTFAEDPRK